MTTTRRGLFGMLAGGVAVAKVPVEAVPVSLRGLGLERATAEGEWITAPDPIPRRRRKLHFLTNTDFPRMLPKPGGNLLP